MPPDGELMNTGLKKEISVIPGDARKGRGSNSHFLLCSLTALGVVYGDIGTSPIYALRECFQGTHPFPPTESNVLGILSLIFWALMIIISVKYLLFVMRADNHGEGGILALLALLAPWQDPARKGRILLFIGLFGAALLYGDGAITPAISVLSAVEGLEITTPGLKPYVVPITVIGPCSPLSLPKTRHLPDRNGIRPDHASVVQHHCLPRHHLDCPRAQSTCRH